MAIPKGLATVAGRLRTGRHPLHRGLSRFPRFSFPENRRFVTRLIYSKNAPFSIKQIEAEYQKSRGKGCLMVDGSLNVAGYVRRMEEFGALTLKRGMYSVA